jgi:hypothetical protein
VLLVPGQPYDALVGGGAQQVRDHLLNPVPPFPQWLQLVMIAVLSGGSIGAVLDGRWIAALASASLVALSANQLVRTRRWARAGVTRRSWDPELHGRGPSPR